VGALSIGRFRRDARGGGVPAWHGEDECAAGLLGRARARLAGVTVPFCHPAGECPVTVLADAYEELHAGAHGCPVDGCARPDCALIAGREGPGWHERAVEYPEVRVLARAYGRLHGEVHGCALAACASPPCARLADVLVPGWHEEPGSTGPAAGTPGHG
jgi:hypothetical protein